MYIEPNSTIKFYKNVPLDPSYNNTLFFDNMSAQNSYFHATQSILKYTLTRNSYQRVMRGKMRVGIQADSLYDCNYLAFQNSAYGVKWFYAFITGVEYLNNEASEVTFEIDVMQTYLFDVTLLQSFIEREHTSDDTIGSNLIEENLEKGEYFTSSFESTGKLNQRSIVMLGSFDVDGETLPYGNFRSGIYNGCKYIVFPYTSDGVTAINAMLEFFSRYGKIDQVLGIFIMPTNFITDAGATTPTSYTITATKDYTNFEGYVPKNNKLYTYPYNFLYVSNLQGNCAVFPYEYFSTSDCEFTLVGTALANSEIMIYPNKYKGTPAANLDEYLSLTGYPQCSFNVDTFKAWLAQNGAQIGVSVLSSAVSFGLNTGNITNAFDENRMTLGMHDYSQNMNRLALGTSIGNTLAEVQKHSIAPLQNRGSQSPSLLCANNMIDFMLCKKKIRKEYAIIIDEYFTMYGYATHRVKVPNRNVRKQWTYTKTKGCNITGSCPADDVATIKSIYDKGITFWRNPANVGNYSLDNSIG